jgi:hypothetical protein
MFLVCVGCGFDGGWSTWARSFSNAGSAGSDAISMLRVPVALGPLVDDDQPYCVHGSLRTAHPDGDLHADSAPALPTGGPGAGCENRTTTERRFWFTTSKYEFLRHVALEELVG